MRSRAAEIVALVLVFVAAASAWPVNLTGQRAYKIVRGLTDDRGTDWLDVHMERAETVAPMFYTLAALAAGALIAPRKWPRSSLPLSISTLALAILCAVASGWIALAGGQIRHPEFRTASPPAEPAEHHTH